MKIEPDIVQMAPVALYNFLKHDRKDLTGATILIDVGAENTNLVISDGDRVWIRNIPLGGNNFTAALAKEFKLPFSKAENLKRHAAESKHARQVFQAMRPVFGDLLTEIQRSIGYYTSLHRDSRVENVVAMGNAFRLAGLTKFVSQNLGVEVLKVEGFPSLGDGETLAAPLFRENVLSFGVPFGLAVQGCGLATIGTSLLPPEILGAKVMRRKRPFFVAAGVAVLGAVGCFGYNQVSTYQQVAGGASEVKKLTSEVNGLTSENKRQQELFEAQKKLLVAEQGKIGEIAKLVDNADYGYEVLRTLWDAWPYDKSFEGYDPKTDKPPRSTLGIIEMLSLTGHYVPDVRAYSEAGASAAAAAAPAATPAEPGAPAAQPAAGGGAMPGMLVEFFGITPRLGQDGFKFVNETLMTGLKKCKRTVQFPNPGGEKEMLAQVKKTGTFRNQAEYQDFAPRTVAPAAPSPGVASPAAVVVDKGGDFWFLAQWVVEIGPLREDQRRQVFAEILAISRKAGLEDPRGIGLAEAQAKNLDPEKAKELDREAVAMAQQWLIARDELARIVAEGVIKEWSKEGAPAPK
jgi:hypothetical protein